MKLPKNSFGIQKLFYTKSKPWVVTVRLNQTDIQRGLDVDVSLYRTEKAAERYADRLSQTPQGSILVQVLHRRPGQPQIVQHMWKGEHYAYRDDQRGGLPYSYFPPDLAREEQSDKLAILYRQYMNKNCFELAGETLLQLAALNHWTPAHVLLRLYHNLPASRDDKNLYVLPVVGGSFALSGSQGLESLT